MKGIPHNSFHEIGSLKKRKEEKRETKTKTQKSALKFGNANF